MADMQRPNQADWLQEPKKMSETLKVITILTFIGSGLAIVTQIYSFLTVQNSYDQIVANQDKLERVPGFLKTLMGSDPVGAARKAAETRTPMLILNVVAAILCIYGAIQMRQLKKVGFPIYLIGELLPFAAILIFLGVSSVFTLLLGFVFSLVFIILYATQRKNLVN